MVCNMPGANKQEQGIYPVGTAYAKAQRSLEDKEHVVCLGNHEYSNCCAMELGE